MQAYGETRDYEKTKQAAHNVYYTAHWHQAELEGEAKITLVL